MQEMSSKFLICLSLVVITAAFSGCRKADAKTELEKAADVLAQTEESGQPPPPQPEVQPAAAVEAPSPVVQPPTAPAPTPSQQMQQALASYKAGEMEDAVTRLHRLRAAPTLTAQQRIAVQDSMAAVMNEVYEMAAKGDARAIAAVKQYEQMQSAPRH